MIKGKGISNSFEGQNCKSCYLVRIASSLKENDSKHIAITRATGNSYEKLAK